jgi:hypothetical protein
VLASLIRTKQFYENSAIENYSESIDSQINNWLDSNITHIRDIDIKYSHSCFISPNSDDGIFTASALLIYREIPKELLDKITPKVSDSDKK